MSKLTRAALAAPLFALILAAPAAAASNPAGHGQPGTANPNGVACGNANAQSMPPGFSSGGFVHAGTVYAGAVGSGSTHSGNSHAVAEYDIACYQVSQ
ncbi:MAG TPA: hypothetical protein VGS61_00245 [Acidimicrobiales bacterium]|nr:hypothetical protein [Acidimicrobiales bacterium]